ncbi:MAG: hypothetical protein ABTQ32_01305 [Myxococcaceae bacterium]
MAASAEEFVTASVIGGRTVPRQRDVLEVGVGHSDLLTVAWRHGVTDRFEAGLAGAGMLATRPAPPERTPLAWTLDVQLGLAWTLPDGE